MLNKVRGALGSYFKKLTGTHGARNLRFLRKTGRSHLPGLTRAVERAVRDTHSGLNNAIGTYRRAEALASGVASGDLQRASNAGEALVKHVKHSAQDLTRGWGAAKKPLKGARKRAGTSLQGDTKRRRTLSADALLEMKQLAGGA